jgi:hypothetical protein
MERTASVKDWQKALEARADLARYESNAIGLFALVLKFGLDDIESVAAESLTDGRGDKKCDIVYIAEDEGIAVVVQCYRAATHKSEASSNKASDLATALGWLLHAPLGELPERIKPSAIQLRQAINLRQIDELHIWYVHNLPESENVHRELLTVESTVNAMLKVEYTGKNVSVRSLEVGSTVLEEWYHDTQSPILVSDEFVLAIKHGFEIRGAEWEAFVTTVPARFLHEQYKKYSTRLFSANVRDYLGARKSDANINYNIMRSAEERPSDFWVYNNGVTILVNDYSERKEDGGRRLVVSGLSIVNGAQTTGALGTLDKEPAASAIVPVRFVKTTDTEVIDNIIRYNNSQNRVTASDFRSTDSIQRRLREEIAKIPEAEYQGGRRGGYAAAIARNPKLLPSYTVGQALAAFHGDPVAAYNRKSEIWASDRLYSKYFNDQTTGIHIVFAYSLVRAAEERKHELFDKTRTGSALTRQEELQLSFYRQRGATYLLVWAVASCLETIFGRPIPNTFLLSFAADCSPKKGEEMWRKVVSATVPFCHQLTEAFDEGLKAEKVEPAVEKFQSLVAATVEVNSDQYKEFARKVVGVESYPRAAKAARRTARR